MTTPGTGEPRYTRDELVAELGLSAEYAEKIWNAFGFARTSTPDKIFTEADLDALRLFADSEDTMPQTAQVATARAIGQTMARLADWQADQLREFDRDPDVPFTIDQMSAALGQVQQLIWRRHLALALDHGVELESDESHDLVVGFADIVGYTSLSRRIALDELEQLLESFEENAFEIVVANGGHVIKTLGDAVMFTAHHPSEAAVIAIAIHRLSESDEIPPLRVGLARGRVLSRLGDVFGEPVNIAARLAGSARPGTILVDDAVATGLAEDERFYLRSIPSLNVRGYRRLKARTLEVNKYYDGPVDDGTR
ncbi:adenylate/guanylate cyclase domain-containing protein [Gordonia sp. Z-3]|jgi:adenylate cyclase|uniref:Adenylate/guanylate cyclase domain-containing protein n=2 Tax=Gordonia TaxID=2053 RepID=A0A9X3D2E4_9ACTN|nr:MULTISPECIES: adenylate/guanylate cyclase domain-containing protein [Gordonia]MAU81365.1 guanylyl cyclase [Gordonia sp. (in: high G+C Gram-positive bacteria)]MCF3938105.1 adenylate/guanylate cyclase domain-containing protein [Gordonia tangerina]MCX2963678.1 adenylate/guanylate cyclase domain-containing protein [Gordonia aquimaris]MED5802205.1 adenylate/guanylate cyclase domain-containing protein [Gordonia sp. Z-3]